MFWQLYLLAKQSDASEELRRARRESNAELKRIRQELEIVRREQQQEREERREEMRRAALTPEQRAEEDRQKAEAEAARVAEEDRQKTEAFLAKAAAAKRQWEEDKAATGAGMAVTITVFVAVLLLTGFWALTQITSYQPPKPNQSTSNIQSANPNPQPSTPVTDKTTSEMTKKRGGNPH